MARSEPKRYLAILYNGKSEHKLELSRYQKQNLMDAWKNKDTDFMLKFGNGRVIRMNLSRFEVISYAPIETE